MEGQSGEHTAPPGISLFTTVKVPDSPNTLTLFFEGEKMAVLARACYEQLILQALCSENPASQLKWKIIKPNAYAVEVTWKILLSDPKQTGTLTLQANGGYIFYTDTIADDDNIGMIFVAGVLQGDAIAGSFVPCPPDNGGGNGGGNGTVPDQEIVDLPGIGVPQLPEHGNSSGRCGRVRTAAGRGLGWRRNLTAETEQGEQLPQTDGLASQLPYLAGMLMAAAGAVMRRKIK